MPLELARLVQVLILAAALLAVCLLGYKFWEHRIRRDEAGKVEARLQAAWEKRLRQAEGNALQSLREHRRLHERDYRKLADRTDALARELRQRSTRAEQAQHPHPLTAIACPVCTGEGLAREDAEFLAGEAAGAAAQQLELHSARSAYDTCRKTLEEVTRGVHNDMPEKSSGIQP